MRTMLMIVTRPSRMDIQFVDYDHVRFHLSTPTSKTSITLSMGIQCWSDLRKHGAMDHLKQEFGAYLSGEVEPEYDVSLVLDLEQLPQSPGTLSPNREHGDMVV